MVTKEFFMSNAVYFVSYNLKKGASVQDFLLATEKLNNEYMSKQKGYISWKQLLEDDMRVDLLTFENNGRCKKSIEPKR